MKSGSPETPARLSSRFRSFASNPYRSQIPVVVGFLVCILLWALTQSSTDLEYSLFGLCLMVSAWEIFLLFQQNRSENRPAPERVEAHNWLRARAIAWTIVATAAAGLILIAARINGTLAPTLIPASNFELTEIVVLALTIAVLAVLTRYTAISSYVESGRTSDAIRAIMGEVRAALTDLKTGIDALTREVGRLGVAQAPRPHVQGSAFHISPSKSDHRLAWRLTGVEAPAFGVRLTVTVDGVPRTTIQVGDLAVGAHKEGTAGNVVARQQAGEISLEVTYADSGGRSYTDSFEFVYTVETGFWGGIKAVNVTRA